MSQNQLHGKKFEDFVKGCGRFPGASDSSRSATAGFDIEARFDREAGLATSIKTTCNTIVALSDARRFWMVTEPFRMIVGSYRQLSDRKQFSVIHEFVLSAAALTGLKGNISARQVGHLHNGIATAKFALGLEASARAWVRAERAHLDNESCSIRLNPKIDSKGQRRLQCSVSLANLQQVASSSGEYVRHEDRLGDFALPVFVFSGRREFSR